MHSLSRHSARSFFNIRRYSQRLVPSTTVPPNPSVPMSTTTRSSTTDTQFNLDRFVRIQDHRRNYHAALAEIQRGRKDSHWIWFVFPQIAGLGRHPSEMTRHFAIGSAAEAEAYLAHPVLGPRLAEISRAVLDSPVREVGELMGRMSVDQQKLKSSMTLFKRVVDGLAAEERREGDEVFEKVLEKYFDGEEDEETVKLLNAG
ncbi:DUF1810-domain-containing protein [Coniochaeta sp. PMI_546]|nr:DUF1810-domain-containing protein [Coniochaeta sp. PMI_546]